MSFSPAGLYIVAGNPVARALALAKPPPKECPVKDKLKPILKICCIKKAVLFGQPFLMFYNSLCLLITIIRLAIEPE
jgi:hypothetical protein